MADLESFAVSQYEIRFAPILNFNNEVKPVLAKLLALFDHVTINNRDTSKESIQLISKVDRFQIFLEWNHLLLRFDDYPLNLDKNSTPIKAFYKVYDAVKSAPSFSMAHSHLLYTFFVQVKEEEVSELIEQFRQKHFGQPLNQLVDVNFSGLSVRFEEAMPDQSTIVEMGVFRGYSDFDSRNFKPLEETVTMELLAARGQYVEINRASKIENQQVSASQFVEISKDLDKVKNAVFYE